MTKLINLIAERKFNEAEQELSSMFVSIMEQKLFEMKKATAAKMCEQMGLGPTTSQKRHMGIIEAADPKEDSLSVERGTPQPPKNTTVIQKNQPGSTHYKNMEEEAEQLDELSDKAKKEYVDAVRSKPGIFKGIRHSSLAGIETDKETIKNQIEKSKRDPKLSSWSTSELEKAHKNLATKHERRKSISDKVAASLGLEESANQEELEESDLPITKKKEKIWIHTHKTSGKEKHMNTSKPASDEWEVKALKEETLDEARINIIKARIRGGKIQRRKKVSNVPGMTLRGGTLKRMSAAERRRRKMGARKGKVKRRAKMTRILMKRKRSLQKRKSLGL